MMSSAKENPGVPEASKVVSARVALTLTPADEEPITPFEFEYCRDRALSSSRMALSSKPSRLTTSSVPKATVPPATSPARSISDKEPRKGDPLLLPSKRRRLRGEDARKYYIILHKSPEVRRKLDEFLASSRYKEEKWRVVGFWRAGEAEDRPDASEEQARRDFAEVYTDRRGGNMAWGTFLADPEFVVTFMRPATPLEEYKAILRNQRRRTEQERGQQRRLEKEDKEGEDAEEDDDVWLPSDEEEKENETMKVEMLEATRPSIYPVLKTDAPLGQLPPPLGRESGLLGRRRWLYEVIMCEVYERSEEIRHSPQERAEGVRKVQIYLEHYREAPECWWEAYKQICARYKVRHRLEFRDWYPAQNQLELPEAFDEALGTGRWLYGAKENEATAAEDGYELYRALDVNGRGPKTGWMGEQRGMIRGEVWIKVPLKANQAGGVGLPERVWRLHREVMISRDLLHNENASGYDKDLSKLFAKYLVDKTKFRLTKKEEQEEASRSFAHCCKIVEGNEHFDFAQGCKFSKAPYVVLEAPPPAPESFPLSAPDCRNQLTPLQRRSLLGQLAEALQYLQRVHDPPGALSDVLGGGLLLMRELRVERITWFPPPPPAVQGEASGAAIKHPGAEPETGPAVAGRLQVSSLDHMLLLHSPGVLGRTQCRAVRVVEWQLTLEAAGGSSRGGPQSTHLYPHVPFEVRGGRHPNFDPRAPFTSFPMYSLGVFGLGIALCGRESTMLAPWHDHASSPVPVRTVNTRALGVSPAVVSSCVPPFELSPDDWLGVRDAFGHDGVVELIMKMLQLSPEKRPTPARVLRVLEIINSKERLQQFCAGREKQLECLDALKRCRIAQKIALCGIIPSHLALVTDAMCDVLGEARRDAQPGSEHQGTLRRVLTCSRTVQWRIIEKAANRMAASLRSKDKGTGKGKGKGDRSSVWGKGGDKGRFAKPEMRGKKGFGEKGGDKGGGGKWGAKDWWSTNHGTSKGVPGTPPRLNFVPGTPPRPKSGPFPRGTARPRPNFGFIPGTPPRPGSVALASRR